MLKEMTNKSHNYKRGDKSCEKKKIVFLFVCPKIRNLYIGKIIAPAAYILFILERNFPKKRKNLNRLQMNPRMISILWMQR